MNGRVVLITGASGGLGPVVTRAFLDAGATVAASSRRSPDFPADLLDPVQAKALADKVFGQFGRIDALVHLAGGFAGGAVHETDDATWNQMMDMNLRSSFHVFRAVIPHLRAAGKGRIVAVSSRAAIEPGPGVAAYAASKAALISLVRSIAVENKDSGISANAIVAGNIDTDAKRREIASIALCLVSDAAAEITGTSVLC